jgi:hypothetical protein
VLSSAAAPMPPGRHTFSRVRIRHKSLSVPLWLAALQGTEPGTITFFKNGERLGVAFSNVTGELRPCVDLFDYGDRVRMLNTSHP